MNYPAKQNNHMIFVVDHVISAARQVAYLVIILKEVGVNEQVSHNSNITGEQHSLTLASVS